MRIAILVDKLNIDAGGSNRSMDLLASKLDEYGHQVTIITTNITDQNNLPSSNSYDIIEAEIATTTPFNMYRNIYSLLQNYESEFDLYHVFKPLLISIAGYYRKKGGKTPVIGRLNSYSIFCTNSTLMDGSCHKDCSMSNKILHDDTNIKNKFLRFPYYLYNNNFSVKMSNSVDLLFAQSPSVKEIYSEVGLDASTIDVIPNFYDDEFNSGKREEYDQRDIDLLFVGRLEHGKGVDILLESIDESDTGMKVHIIGDGKYKDELEKTYVMENVKFHGWVPHSQLQDIYNNSKYFVHPGRWPDPCPRTILEAMQNQCVPIVSDIGGPPWMIGNAGEIFESENTEELSDILKYISNNRKNYEEKVSNIDNELERFSSENIIDEIETRYAQIVENASV